MKAKYEKLYQTRLEKGITQGAVAEAIGISKAFFCQIENKQRRLTYPMAIRIAGVLGMKPDEIFYDDIKKLIDNGKSNIYYD